MDYPPLDPAAILFEDHHLIAINKPAPLLTQAPEGIPSLEGLVKAYIKEKYEKPAGVYLGIPHRLDRPVSGVVVFARNTKAAQRVHKQFQDRKVRKTYWAAVEGLVTPSKGIWEDWIRKIQEEGRTVRAEPDEPGAKFARLAFRTIRSLDNATLIEFAPETGRMHQLRVQSAWRGHPIFGDTTYGEPRPFGPNWDNPRDKTIALHARGLELDHPFTRERLTLVAPLPAYWNELGEPGQS
jgi:23S rRNA pseudouridine1911/1915/1917 synthase